MSRLVLNWMTPPEREAIFRRAWEYRAESQKLNREWQKIVRAVVSQQPLSQALGPAALGYGWPNPISPQADLLIASRSAVLPCPTCGRWA